MTEKFMKKSIDLYKVINDHCFQRVQDKVPKSDAIGLTKEQRTRMASQESRQDANKGTYLKIQQSLLDAEAAATGGDAGAAAAEIAQLEAR